MKPAAVPVLCIDAFPQTPPQAPFRLQRLEELRASFADVNEPHAHDFYVLLYFTHGHGTHTIDFVTYEVRPGALFFLTPGQVHSWSLSDDTRGIDIFFTPAFYLLRHPAERLYSYPFFGPHGQPVLYLPPDEPLIGPLLWRMEQEHAMPSLNQQEVLRSYLHLVLELAARQHQPEPTAGQQPGLHQLRAFERLLNERFRTHKAVRDYAEWLHLTPNHLNALCRRLLAKTASNLIHERVVVEAKRLLHHSALSVAEVAYNLGFDDASYFSRYFRKYAGLTPEAFRGRR
ncbi:AraC family transcriptional regulator [Solirubrum puertoriconensis]|uniref:HTH araC/xylS-type domain-containing protein n=1 Tax=Solirubrum puertoriconensis TaxID=1751427 RepID=A0A9X0HII6_SOLP1|nr:AraC family transcriptional regulator [Solirubrum puertoriconensis]KUG06538.1 hypothetical protein ASU33_04095 [Solirubrum puertoriconensis]